MTWAHGPAVFGQPDVLTALRWLAVDPRLGGIIVVGLPGGGDDQLARALAELLAPSRPVFTAPPGLTPELLQGVPDWEATWRAGRLSYAPGLWHRACGCVLHVPRGEFLIPAAAAWMSRALDEPGPHPVLVVTWDRRELQALATSPLAHRLGFCLSLESPADAGERLALLRAARGKMTEGETDLPNVLRQLWGEEIEAARRLLAHVRTPAEVLSRIARAGASLGNTNPRLEILTLWAARARAALAGRTAVTLEDADEAVGLVLAARSAPFSAAHALAGQETGEQPTLGEANGAPSAAGSDYPSASRGREAAGTQGGTQTRRLPGSLSPVEAVTADGSGRNFRPTGLPGGPAARERAHAAPAAPEGSSLENVQEAPALSRAAASPHAAWGGPLSQAELRAYRAVADVRSRRAARALARLQHSGPSRQGNPRSSAPPFSGTPPTARRRPSSRGRPALPVSSPGSTPVPLAAPGKPGPSCRLDVTATLLAALPHQPFRPRPDGRALVVWPHDLRWQRPSPRPGALFVLIVDTSGSMGAHQTRAAKGLAAALLREAYIHRDEVCLIRCSGRRPALVLPPSRSTAAAQRALSGMPTGGGTPLPASLDLAFRQIRLARRRFPHREVALLVLTDGRANVPLAHPPFTAPASSSTLASQLKTLATAIRREGAAMAVVARDRKAMPATDARALAALLQCPFWPL